MTNRTITYVPYCCKDKYGIQYGVFRQKVQTGGNYLKGEPKGTPHQYSCQLYNYQHPLITTVSQFNGATEDRSSRPYTPGWKTIDSNMVYIKALGKLFGDVKGADFNAAISSVEMHQNIRMIGDNARRIAKAYSSVRRGNFAAAYKALAMKAKTPGKNAARHWLELQYGWIPLLKDVHEAAKFVQHRMSDPVIPRYRVRASEKLTGAVITSTTKYSQVSVEQRCQLIYYPSAPLTIAEALGLTDPYSVLWEKLPYSFVIDWFLPVGPWLEAATAARTLKGRVVRTDVNIKLASGLESIYGYNILGGGNVDWKQLVMSRIPTGQPTPPALPTFRPLEKALSVRHALNGVALLANLKHM